MESGVTYGGKEILSIDGQVNECLTGSRFHVLITNVFIEGDIVVPYSIGDGTSVAEFSEKMLELKSSLGKSASYDSVGYDLSINFTGVSEVVD